MGRPNQKEKADHTLEHLRLAQMWPPEQRARLEKWAHQRGVAMSAAILTIVADRLDADEVPRV